MNSHATSLLKSKDYSGALVLLNQILESSETDNLLTSRLSVSHCHTELGNYETALNFVENAIRSNPNNPRCYLQRSRIFLRLRDFSLALNDCETGIGLDPTNPVSSYSLLK